MRAEHSAIVALAVIVLAVGSGCDGDDPPRLQVTAVPGSISADGRADAAVRVRYQLRNAGGRTLLFDGVVPACGCRPSGEVPAELVPGAAATLDVECRAPESVGETIRELRLRSNDPTSPSTALRMTLRNPTPGPVPAALYLGYVAVGAAAVRDVVVPGAVVNGGAPAPERPDLAVEAAPPRPDGARAVRVRFAPRAAGVVRTTVNVGGVVVPVTAVAYDRVIAYPAEVALSSARGGAAAETVTLIAAGASPLALARVDYPPGMSGELRVVDPGRAWRLVLRGRPTRGGAESASVRLYDATGAAPIATIPLAGVAIPLAGGAREAPSA